MCRNREAEVPANTRSESESADVATSYTSGSNPVYRADDVISNERPNSRVKSSLEADEDSQTKQSDDIDHAIRIYADHIHGQPLLLFEQPHLARQIQSWPSYLLEVFRVSASRWASDGALNVIASNRSALLKQARHEIMFQAMQTNMNVQVLQALCLLILEEIAGT